MNDIDSSNDKYTNDSDDKYSIVKYTNDSILTRILLFGKVSLNISASTLILTWNNEIYHINEQISKMFF